eukprot:jgi/Tetstr1/447522/TSEL_034902.t1
MRPQRREEHAFQEDTTTASMDTDNHEKQQDAGFGTFMAALRDGKVALLFGDLMAQHQAMDEESRSRTVTNLIRTLSPEIGVQILPADVRVMTRRPPKPTAADTARPISTRLPTTTRGLTEADIWRRLAEGLLPAYDQPQPCEAAAGQLAATPADVLALAGPRRLQTDILRLAVALTSPVALLRAIRLRTIVIYLTESEFDPSELHIHPFTQTIREAGELGGNTGHNKIRRAAIGMRKKARKTAPASLALRATGRPIYTFTLQLTAHHHSIIAPAATATTRAHADDEEELDLNYEEMDSAMKVDTTQEGAPSGTTKTLAELQHLTTATKELLAQSSPANQPAIAAELASHAAETHQPLNPQRLSIQLERHPSKPTPAGKGKTARAVKLKKKQARGRSRSDGATRNRSGSKPRLSGTRGSDSDSAYTIEAFLDLVAKAFSPSPEIAELSFSLDFSERLRPHFQDHIQDISKPHKLEFTRDDTAASGGSLRTAFWSNTLLSEPVQILKNAPTGTHEIRAGRPLLYALCDKKKPDAVKVQRYLDDFKKVRSYITDLAVQWHFSPVERESRKNLLDDLDEMQTAPSAAFSGFWPQRKEEVDDFLREHGQTAPAEARHTMATNAYLNNAEAARVEAEVRAQVLQDESAFRGVHAGAKERHHDNTSPSDAKGSNLVVIDVSDAIHDASGSREVFNEDGTMVRKKCGVSGMCRWTPMRSNSLLKDGYGDTIKSFLEDADAAAFSTLAGIWGVSPDLLDTPSMRAQLSLPVQFGGLGIGDNVVFAYASQIGVAALVVGLAVTFLRAQHATLSDAGASPSDSSSVSSPHA